jgi:hypothetical protein
MLSERSKGDGFIGRMPETSFNNRLAQMAFGKQKRSIIEKGVLGVFVSQAHNVIRNSEDLTW